MSLQCGGATAAAANCGLLSFVAPMSKLPPPPSELAASTGPQTMTVHGYVVIMVVVASGKYNNLESPEK